MKNTPDNEKMVIAGDCMKYYLLYLLADAKEADSDLPGVQELIDAWNEAVGSNWKDDLKVVGDKPKSDLFK